MWKHARMTGLASFVVAGIVSGACVQEADVEEKPDAPDISAIVEAYANPTLPLNDDTADGILEYVEEATRLVEDLEIEEQVLEPLFEALEEEYPGAGGAGGATGEPSGMLVRTSSSDSGPVRSKSLALELAGDGFLRVSRICEGWGEPVVDEELNGSLKAIIGFSDSGLDPVIWGDFTACRYQTGAGNVLLEAGDGPVDAGVVLHIGDALESEDLGTEPILFVLNLDATIDGEFQEVRLSFRLDQETGRFEFLFETGEGSLVLLVEDGALVGVNAADGEYSCDSSLATCTSASDEVVQL